eukprot:Tamp_18874.p1 GENE.Tamp_18874~~Tamp_18874.p1  ORF type:complete len:347 (+),score=70.09 Tamp_18874:133-1041(+)
MANQQRPPVARASRHASLRCSAASAGEEAPAPALPAPNYRVPKDDVQMIQDCADAIARAQADGVTRHKIRLMLPGGEVASWGTLCPVDESWEGGIMQLYKACTPLVRQLLRKTIKNDLAPKLDEQRLDDSGVDGISLWSAQCQKARDDMYAFCQPSTETVDALKQVCNSAGPRSVLLVNPQWRETKDGYDLAGEKPGLFGQIGNFLGGTAGARKEVTELGFKDVYLLQEYTVNGDACRILKSYPNPNWLAYIIQDEKEPFLLGEQPGRPTYQDIAKMLEEKGIAARWARDMGIGGGMDKTKE